MFVFGVSRRGSGHDEVAQGGRGGEDAVVGVVSVGSELVLFWSSQTDNWEVARMLVQAGADFTLKSESGRSIQNYTRRIDGERLIEIYGKEGGDLISSQ